MKKILCVLFVLTSLVLIGSCDVNNPIIDEWWIGETPAGITETDTTRVVIPITTFIVMFDMVDTDAEYFDALNGNSSSIEPQILKDGALASEPGLVIIDADDNDEHDTSSTTNFFGGWWTAETGGERWVFSSNKVNAAADQLDGEADGIIHLYARWIPATGYTVNFEHGGDFDESDSIDHATEIDWSHTIYTPEPEYVAQGVELSQPKGFGLLTNDSLADKYIFTGWYIDNDNNHFVNKGDTKWDFNDTVTTDMTLYAGWGVKTGNGVITPENAETPTKEFTVTFDESGADNTVPDEKVLDGNPVTRPAVVYKTGEAFTGWHTDSPTGPLYTFSTPVTGNITLYAGWASKNFDVTFDSNGGDYIDLVNDPENTNLDGNGDPDYINPPEQRLVTGSSELYEPGLVIGPPDRRYFGGWYTTPDTGGVQWVFNSTAANETFDVVNGSGDDGVIELYARWSNTGYTVKFEPNGDFDGNGYIGSDEIDFKKTIYEPRPEYVALGVTPSQPKGFGLKPGDLANKYAFTGWYKDNNNNKTVDADDTKWDFSVSVDETADLLDGNDDNTISIYAGWGTRTANGVIPPEEGGAPIPAYTVMFDDNDADNPKPTVKLVPDEVVLRGNTVPKPDALHKKDYAFTGWYKDSLYEIPWDFSHEVEEADDTNGRNNFDDNKFTLYAGWEPIPYTQPWFDENFTVSSPRDTPDKYYPFQCDPGKSDWGDVTNPDDDNANYGNLDKVIDTLKRHPNYIAQIIGYKDSPNDNLDTEREAATWWSLITETGVNPEQIILNTKLPEGVRKGSSDMIIGPNESAGVVGPDEDEVKIYIYAP